MGSVAKRPAAASVHAPALSDPAPEIHHHVALPMVDVTHISRMISDDTLLDAYMTACQEMLLPKCAKARKTLHNFKSWTSKRANTHYGKSAGLGEEDRKFLARMVYAKSKDVWDQLMS